MQVESRADLSAPVPVSVRTYEDGLSIRAYVLLGTYILEDIDSADVLNRKQSHEWLNVYHIFLHIVVSMDVAVILCM